jgi:putative phosphoribosyl transferase
VFALSRGSVPVAAPIAAALHAPDMVLVRKIGTPFQPKLALGAVADGGSPIIVRNESVIEQAHVSEADFDAACRGELAGDRAAQTRILRHANAPEAKGGVAIVVDDGVATGSNDACGAARGERA